MSFLLHLQSQRQCFDMYVVHLKPVELETDSGRSRLHELEVIESDWVIPSLHLSSAGDEILTLNVTTNSTLRTNTFYNATLITTMDTMEVGNFQFCKCTVT